MIQTAKELAAACKSACGQKTLYVLGSFGWPMTEKNKARALQSYAFNCGTERQAKIQNASADTFGFDCVCFLKSLLWGWHGDPEHAYGGAAYESNGVPDIDADAMMEACLEVSEDFSNIAVGEAVWIKGHIGLYVGDGLAVECTYRWDDGVQLTAVHNIAEKAGYHGRFWTKHGKLPYVRYEQITAATTETEKADYSLKMRNLKKGCAGEDVRALQTLLLGIGYDLGASGADGDFGSKTDEAVRKFQSDRDLAVDGIAGKKTMGSLLGV